MKRLTRQTPAQTARRGNVLVLSAMVFSMLLAFTAFVVDVGYIVLSRSELAATADAAALAATIEMADGFSSLTQTQVATNAKNAAVATAGANGAAGLNSVYCNPTRDVKLGKYSWDAATSTWVTTWNATPYNVAEVTLHRDQVGSTLGDQQLDLFIAPSFGKDKAGVCLTGKAALLPATGLKKITGVNLDILPITLDLPTWTALEGGTGTDLYSYNSSTGAITSGADGVKEVNLYPLPSGTTTAGNRGTVDIGSSNNSTADISRQILYGINDDDMSYFGGQFNWSSGSITLNGDTGLSAGIKDELITIKGQPRMIPIFTSVSGPGNNANYIITKFVGIRILHVQLTGNQKKVIVQPASFVSAAGVPGTSEVGLGTVFSPAAIVK
jgi:Flp pilus assembly protein TadG